MTCPGKICIHKSSLLNLFDLSLPITDIYKDKKGRSLRLWQAPNCLFFGTITDSNANVSLICTHKIINPSSQISIEDTLQRCVRLGQRQWNLVYRDIQGTITIWPVIKAAGRDDSSAS